MSKSAISEVWATFRQWRYPREFRIPRGPSTERLKALLAAAQAAGRADPPVPPPREDAGGEALPKGTVAGLATDLWRLRGRLDRVPDAPRAVVRHMEAAWSTLIDAGVEITDHLGEPYDPGLVLTVVAFQPTDGLAREEIVETVRPGVYLDGRQLQLAEVIVGTPPPEHTETDAEESSGS
ncbi:hypothetical protein [Thermomonospora umbrina]|uniref:Nucleotide exchange factor GrpE n=1 Tax=Thermomonospora umbrina TaxID=111806 RepID=A0A3D9SMI2_9ACTN|nr:hypothetical protein [Thermomonospora umbrina]REE97132.1 hypothetical protein DFJ69_2589 [Thermomonospora umbrina]